ncbi:MAG: TonB-dependent receptor [Bacteroidota bacterium]
MKKNNPFGELIYHSLKKILLIMRIAIVLLILGALQAHATDAYSQKTRFSLNFSETELVKVLDKIEVESEFFFLYNEKLLDTDRKVSIDAKDQLINVILDDLFASTDVKYTIIDRKIILAPDFLTSELQQNKITGTVTSKDGAPLPGVNVVVTGTTLGTNTDIAGKYSLQVPEGSKSLTFSFIGMEPQVINTGTLSQIDLTMSESAIGLDEVVVIGYRVVKKSDLTGAMGSVQSAKLYERRAINVKQSLAGRISGVNVQTNSGMPGGRTVIAIRGYSSINATNDPLFVVDGIISPGGIDNLNPNDIESINVLKDASSTAIYGTRGSNGVIIITTKRGSKGIKGQISYDGYMSINWLPNDRKQVALNSKQWLYIEEEQYKNAPKFDPVGFANGKYGDPIKKRMNYLVGNKLGNRELFSLDENGIPQPLYDVNWEDMCIRTTISQSHNLSYTGGDQLTNYGLFLGSTDENGIIKRSFAKRISVRAVVDRQMLDWLKVGGTFSYARMNQGGINDGNSYDVLREMVEQVPFIPYKYEDGSFGTAIDYKGLESQDSPLAKINEKTISFNTNTFSGNTYVTFKLISGLEFTSTFGSIISNNINNNFSSSKLIGNKNTASINSSESKFWQWSNKFNYIKQINDEHGIDVLAGVEMQSQESLNWGSSTNDMPDDYYLWYNLSAGATASPPSSQSSGYQMESYFGRLNYNFKGKYLMTVTGRSDGSSRFGADNKFAFFPSSALAWKISEENFIKNIRVISNLKLRVSYGLTGNSEIGSYRSLANLGTNNYIFGNTRVIGATIDRLANPMLQWEKTAEFDIGFDLGLLKNRITLEGDFYLRRTHDLLFDAPVPATSGYTTVTKNIGSIENKGVELSLSTINILKVNFSWSTSFNFTTLKSTILSLGKNNEDIYYGFKEALILQVGESAGSIFGYVRDGIWSIGEESEAAVYKSLPGDLRIVDQNKDGVINNQDRVIIGKGIPDFYGTLSNTIRYKNFDFLVELQYSYGNDIFNNARNSGEARQGIANSYATVLDAWTPENQDALLEQIRPTAAYYHYYMDTRKLSDGSFIRGKNMVLGYILPNSVSSKWGLNTLRIYASAQNVFLITKYFGYDPEISSYYDNAAISQGMAYSGYPKPRTFMLVLC